jgi:phenylacetic acid degradation operon negative regulatory protein
VADRRSPSDRNDLRTAAGQLRLAVLREGVWIRPDNLSPDRLPAAQAVVRRQCQVFTAQLTGGDRPGDAAELAASLWDLEAWATRALELQRRIGALVDSLEGGDLDALAPGFVASAAVLRHFQADPLLPAELLPPGWPGPALRSDYDRYDAAFKQVWRAWYRAQGAS